MAYTISTANSSLEFDTQTGFCPACCKIDSSHFIGFWEGPDSDGFAQVFAYNTGTKAITTAGSSLEFYTGSAYYFNGCAVLDANHFVNTWSADGYLKAQVFAVNTSTWAVTTAGGVLDITTSNSDTSFFKPLPLDENHFFVVHSTSSGVSYVQIFEVNTSTWAVSTSIDKLGLVGSQGHFNTLVPYLIDDTHILFPYATISGTSLNLDVLSFSTSTWAISTASAATLTISGVVLDDDYAHGWIEKVDDTHYILFYTGSASDGFVTTLAVNTSTWNVTTAASSLEFDTKQARYMSVQKIDTNHFLNFWQGTGSDDNLNVAQVFEVNTSTWAVTTTTDKLTFDTQTKVVQGWNASCEMDTGQYVNMWAGASDDGYVQSFTVSTGGGFIPIINIL